jgi:hypothetical protein
MFPAAFTIAIALGAATGHARSGVAAGAVVSTVGLAFLWLGYALGDVLSGYWMVVVGMTGLPLCGFAWAWLSGFAWVWALVWVGAVLLCIGTMVGIGRNAAGNGGLPQLLKHIIHSFIPGRM